MSDARHTRAKELFLVACERPADARRTFLEQACGDDARLLQEVESLLLHHDGTNPDSPSLPPPDAFLDLNASAAQRSLEALPRTMGNYRVLQKLDEGGMGEVYLAHDTRLGRDVAIKVLPDLFASDQERLARFDREALVLASLNHPHIAQIYGLEDADGIHALVLELVEGPTLADRIAEGPIPLDDALPIARQIAEAMEAAHDAGVIHRDLKPANIKVTPEGTVKVLDFGLAKALGPVGQGSSSGGDDTSESPSRRAAVTRVGAIMGTAAYMSPELAKGKTADRRADIWAFGCVLYEMLSGKPAFEETTVSDTLASVIAREPDWTALPATTPAAINTLLRRSLKKDRRARLPDIAMARIEIDDVLTAPVGDIMGVVARAPRLAWQRPLRVAVAAAVIAGALSSLVVWSLTRPGQAVPRDVRRFRLALPSTQQLTRFYRHVIALSPAGTHLAYIANGRLYLWVMGQLDATSLPGISGPGEPVFSPDGQWVAFHADGSLKKVSTSGGAPVTLCEAVNPFGMSWGSDESILFGQGPEGIFRVPGTGGPRERVISMEEGEWAHGPQLLPDGETVLFTRGTGDGWDEAQIVVESLATGERRVLVDGGTDARYVPTGHLVYGRAGTLLAVPFDLVNLEVTGAPVSMVESIGQGTGTLQFGVSGDGSLAYVPAASVRRPRTLVWVDREGREEPVAVEPRSYLYPRISPDGERVALDVRDEEGDIWIWTLGRESLTRFTFDSGGDEYPVWTPDGQRIVFASHRTGMENIFWKASDGTGTVERLTDSPSNQVPQSVSPDGKWVVFREASAPGGYDLGLVSLAPDHVSELLFQTRFRERNGRIAPDGRWLAYQSDESGQDEVYVRPFPSVAEGRWQISTGGGTQPVWARSGRELFYVALSGRLMAVPIQTGSTFGVGTPEELFATPEVGGQFDTVQGLGTTYDVAPDGQRFLMVRPIAQTEDGMVPTHIVVVENWHQELLERVPVP